MLPKKYGVILTSDFRPIANTRLLYKIFAYMILHRIEATLDMGQAQEQNCFSAGRRMEQHVPATNLILDKAKDSVCQYELWALISQ